MRVTEFFRLPNRKANHIKTGKIRLALGFSSVAFTIRIIQGSSICKVLKARKDGPRYTQPKCHSAVKLASRYS